MNERNDSTAEVDSTDNDARAQWAREIGGQLDETTRRLREIAENVRQHFENQ